MRLRRPIILLVIGAWLAAPSGASADETVPPSADEVFRLSAHALPNGRIELVWAIAPGTYLYRDRVTAKAGDETVALPFSEGVTKDDPVFGPTEIYRNHLDLSIDRPSGVGTLTVTYQGCAEHRLCYPPVTKLVDLKSLAVEDAPD